MMEQIKNIFDVDRGVSPVIGVILMVAITVILAAVIGTFVLGLGDSLEQAPQAQLDATTDSGTIYINHNGGDPLPKSEITINIVDPDGTDPSLSFGGYNTDDELAVGGSINGGGGTLSGTYTVTVVHDPSESILLDTEVEA
ncbi:type IV pilin N-terminal domain-containing protein [Halolamina sp. CBA1230]|uniref:type IV pilin n=1 Tax=Halolamina sp. CBA1230 TaxID=1853690 RepID=UPI0009A24C70|nr:type IV pilin N-terminal domain-containing protein [Halolamina sp. CBA1230]QKY20611.1 type IV pilin N-terminal domain-containing protein [Halolamina sp. CBA1230]